MTNLRLPKLKDFTDDNSNFMKMEECSPKG